MTSRASSSYGFDASEADRIEQATPVRPEDEDTTDTGSRTMEANEADLAEQLQEVPDDDDYPRE
ncbi:hypothetical protein HT102_11660 [Hoyosella sp. G463]|uniref:Uncharacterized protein n=1 Tax=Lolliginicoccus lacisalsi TaxID=2742202 RepID=A0A927JD76_9ACTN|nr:hypothetical protein [Lolliginicoccus lacisalsi]MBD8507146.1 hypothetical protein [Lolliginicoccus lacisalsi]